MLKEFKAFALKGNVVDLAVAVIIGGAFGKIVTSLVNDLIMPMIGIILGGINFSNLKYVITPGTDAVAEASIKYGAFIQSIIDFLIIALVIFIFIKLISGFKRKQDNLPVADPEPSDEAVLLAEIRDLLKDGQKLR